MALVYFFISTFFVARASLPLCPEEFTDVLSSHRVEYSARSHSLFLFGKRSKGSREIAVATLGYSLRELSPKNFELTINPTSAFACEDEPTAN